MTVLSSCRLFSRDLESRIGTGIGTGTGTGTGIGTGMGRETYIKAGTTFTLIEVNLDLIPIQIIYKT